MHTCTHARKSVGSVDNIKIKPQSRIVTQNLVQFGKKCSQKKKKRACSTGLQATAGKPNSIKTRCRCSSPSQKRGNASRDMWGHGRPR